MYKLTPTKDLVERFNRIHGDTYDYSRVDYRSPREKIEIVCKIHGPFFQVANEHARGCGCIKCANERRIQGTILTKPEFIERAVATHGERYDYTRARYVGYKAPLEIVCRGHGPYWITPAEHIRGQGCKECGKASWYEKVKLDTARFISRAQEVHGDRYDYSHVDYRGALLKVDIICHTHGLFRQGAHCHLSGSGCRKCVHESRRVKLNEFLVAARLMHGSRYDYSLVEYANCTTKVTIICSKHGEFLQSPSKHTGGQGCPTCCESGGERAIRVSLEQAGVPFVRQWSHPTCRTKRTLPFDFYLPSINTLIEYDGPQHFGIDWKKHPFDFEKIRKNDAVKTKWAEENGVNFVRIPYTQLESIPEIIGGLFNRRSTSATQLLLPFEE